MTTLESIAWRDVHVEPPTEADGHYVLVFGAELCGDRYAPPEGFNVWFAHRTVGGNWISPDGSALENVTHWAPMLTGADPR